MAEPAKPPASAGPTENEGVNVQVLLRCRPVSDKEVAERTPQVISCNEALREVTLYQNVGGKQMSRTFRFDKVFSQDSQQEKLYKQAIVPIVQEVMDGFNCTIFAYGQTGTGKTYTMEGGPRRSDDGKSLSAEAGVIPRSIKQIFDHIEDTNLDSTVKVTFLELYNEELTDLLSFDDAKDESKRLRLLEDRNGVVVQGLEECIVKSAAEIYQVLDRGTAKRRTAETLLNKRSSRSHSVFSITIHMREVTPEGEDLVKVGKLNLVDLAGSENISRSGAKDGRAREAGSINQSLLTLGRVITALVEHSGHVPYRDSKLTRLLRESLGGKTKTCIIATIAPTVQCQEETISTLDYAHRAKNIRNRPEVNQKISKTAMIKEMSTEMEKLRLELFAQREKNGVYIPAEKHQADELERIQLRDTVKALREQLQMEVEALNASIEEQKAASDKAIQQLQSELGLTRGELQDKTVLLSKVLLQLEEHKYMVKAQRQAEAAVVDAAERLRGELGAAVQDIGGLFASLDELVDVHQGDREAMQRLKQLVAERLGDLGTTLSSAVDQQRQQLGGMVDQLSSFKARKQTDLQQLGEHLATLRASVEGMRTAVERRAEQAEAAATSALSGACGLASAYMDKALVEAKQLEAAAKAAVEALAASLQQEAEQLEAFAAQQAASAAESASSLRTEMQRLGAGFDRLQEASAQAGEQAKQQTAVLSEQLGGFASRNKEATSSRQTVLMSAIMAAVQAFVAEHNGEVEQEVGRLQQKAVEVGAALGSRLGEISEEATKASQTAKETEESVVSSLGCHEQRAAAQATSLQASLQAGAERARSVHTGVADGLQRSSAAAQELSQRMVNGCGSGAAEVKKAVEACKQEAASGAASSQQAQQELQAALEHAVQADSSTADGWAASCSTSSTALDALATDHANRATCTASDVEALTAQRLAVQRAALPPPARAIVVPLAAALQELRCPPEEEILARHRKEFASFYKNVGTTSSSSPPSAPQVSRTASDAENTTPMPPAAGGDTPLPPSLAPLAVPGGGSGSVPPSPRSSAAGIRSRIPSKPSLMGSSPASVKEMSAHVTTRQGLAEKTNAAKSILSDWAA